MRRVKFLFVLIAFIAFTQTSYSQTRQISGTVSSADDGATFPGVTVLVKGTTIGTITDIEGRYEIQVPNDAQTLVFSYVGMLKKEVPIENRSEIDVALKKDLVGLDEVIVTAMGIKREAKALGYSVENVDGEALTRSGESNVITSLAGKAAGVQVLSSSGVPGSSSKILIRGNSTFTGENQPLIVVDGVPIDNRTTSTSANDYPFNPNLQGVNDANRAIDINPEDIESVTILKGPAAAALYGIRAGNGAIVYTTKRGKAGGIKATYSYQLEISEVNKLPALQDLYAQGTGGGGWDFENNRSTQNEAVLDELDYGPDMLFDTDDDVSWGESNSWGPSMESLGRQPYDNVDEFFERAISHTHNLALSGGNEKTSFRLSIGRTDQSGIIPNTDFARTSVRLTSDTEISKKFKVGGTVNYVNSGGTKVQNGSNLAGIMLTLLRTPVNFQLYDEEFGYQYPTGQQRQYFFAYDNPYFSAFESPHIDDVDRVYGNAFADYNPLEWLNITYRVGADVYSDQRKQIFATGSWQATDLSGEIFQNVKRNKEFYSDFLVNLNKSFGEFSTTLTLGQNLNHREYHDLFGRGRQLGVPGFYALSNAAELYSDTYSQYVRTAAVFSVLNMEYSNFLFLNLTARNEWASTFGPNQSDFFYPSANVSFVFSEFLTNNDILSFGKVRAAYAVSGINAPAYSSRTYYTQPFLTDGFTGGLSFPFAGQNGIGYSNILGNPDLRPEQVVGKEVGLDMRFFQGRVNFDLTLYNQTTTDILVQRPLPSSSGFRTVQSNSGEMENKGVELLVSVSPVVTSDFRWDIAVNYSRNRSEVLALAEGVDDVEIASAFASIGSYAIVGNPYGAFYGTKWERTPDGKLIIGDDGLPLVQLENGGIGNPFPDWQSNIRNTFTYKGISLTALIDIREGGDIYAGTTARLNRMGKTEASADRLRPFLVEGVLAEYDSDGNVIYETEGAREGLVKYSDEENTKQISANSYWQNFKGDFAAAEEIVTDGSWIRLRELSVNYRLNTSKMNKFVEYVDFTATGRNLWLLTDYPGVDPETSLTGAGGDPEASGGALTGFDYFNNPSTRSYILSLRFGF